MSEERQGRADLAKHLGIIGSDLSIESSLLVASGVVKSARVRSALAGASIAYTVGKKAWEVYKENREKTTYSIKIYESDTMYATLQRWFMEALPEKSQRSVIAKSRIVKKDNENVSLQPWETSPSSNRKADLRAKIDIFYDGTRRQNVTIAGHVVSVIVQADSVDPAARESGSLNGLASKHRYMTVECQTLEARKAVLNKLQEESQAQVARKPIFFSANKWGEFSSVSDVPPRTIDQVVLKRGQIERIVHDVSEFLSLESEYAKLGIPYHRGILLWGDPGTGKTSVAAAVANHLGLDVFYISLSSIKDDSSLADLLREITPRSVLLLEDIDVAHATKSRSDEDTGITMQGLLNALDGFGTQHGLITIMTTNHKEVLDPALIREGRVDIDEEINCVDQDQLMRLCELFIGYVPEGLPQITIDHRIAPSAVIEVFKKNLRDTAQAGLDLVAELEFKVVTANEEIRG